MVYLSEIKSNLSNLRIAKQIPFKILVKRLFKRAFPGPKFTYAKRELRGVESSFSIRKVLSLEEFPTVDYKGVADHYLKHEFDLLGSGWKSRNSANDLE